MLCLASPDVRASDRSEEEYAAMEVINRFTNRTIPVKIHIDLPTSRDGCDRYSYQANNHKLTIHATSAVAACRAFYDYAKMKGAGFCAWSGRRFVKPTNMSCPKTDVTTIFRDHQYLNVVTYGYTMPFWDEQRWDEEIDWMALHGIDMPLMLVGAEYIYRMVFREMGLNDSEIDEWEVGPAHLPWFRMGNLSGNSFDGPLGNEWNESQRKLAHHILDRMRSLGMKPICPAFGGFVPKAFTKHNGGEAELTGWNWVPDECRNYRLNPASEAFLKVGTRFIQKWEEEYAPCKYYLSDSFNEMIIPDSLELLTQYGDNVFRCIREGSSNPDAEWVTQGWTFVYQSGEWGNEKFKALTKNVPDDRFMLLYMSPEYGPEKCWERYNGFNGKQWNYTMLPNMGGKTFWTGNLQNYAVGYVRNLLASPSKRNATGIGMTPEGLENNEMLYELITDAGWTNNGDSIDINSWLQHYAGSRYGQYPKPMRDFHHTLIHTLYSSYIDHPRFAWQVGNNLTGNGNAVISEEFCNAVETLFSNAEALKAVNSPLLENELIEIASFYLSNKVEQLAIYLKKTGDKEKADSQIATLNTLMLRLDSVLSIHPLLNLERWERQAQAAAKNPATRKRNAVNARRLITIWYGNHTKDEPVQDYASRIWSGLVRDYYRPRLINTLRHHHGLLSEWNRINFENQFVASAPTLSPAPSIKEGHIDFLAKIISSTKYRKW